MLERLTDASPASGDGFTMPAEGADLADPLSWPIHEGDFPIWPENEPVWSLFVLCSNRWHCAGMDGVRVGFDMPGVEFVARTQRFKWSRERMLDFLACESAALDAWAHERKLKAERNK